MNVVLLEPEIHFNTGNIGRTCVGTGSSLHLVGTLGFSLDSAQIRRSGLDYWPKLDLKLYSDWDSFLTAVGADAPLLFFSAEARTDFWDAPYEPSCYLVFGKESTGLPEALRAQYQDRLFRIPKNADIRSYNLSSSAAIVLFEGLRRFRN
ncbi:MAG: tRNA (uridine(34)/cytosine(34)/5-carboxymethylaminomethyluridine(34)-2'-O)-methyltransferase TrmL [Elusimicrobia bacterium CG_4_9_14_3_um_filter_62_55]|nr:MAG: tRNA (uridine(34)/cytosine(34)/5-carboxymethylaminomethyluridine(34)-2'-O)-methyltransferase TrmL [Elusimicrobia bacterium CG22_combo_CG10-13_8_21_14_all_63_91]PJA14916.1 MAG: tRNA (uridine(34)/cytosine(34)/5-carboxymethylaminomethyluridine(34)-2'-O)-methyltransferase TrmL [Elusimicrobia bacterium CG_4_10_14_0_2_um_filter_63_34]PJB25998.1 MAG: tRNA (uridine(34)/cytosine(34)/5-carboxymethylaminomethyluridine(34)-2'-O)-methyltransferase TrmL [Elusimicrobia bacterium CG_4_9_14_3_um_filter_62